MLQVFCCNQLTPRALGELERLCGDGADVRLSVPPFNVPGSVPHGYDKQWNVPCFGVQIPKRVNSLFEIEELGEMSAQLGFRMPAYELSRTLQDKLAKVKPVIAEARRRGFSQPAVERLEKFVRAVSTKQPGEVQSYEEWERFVTELCGSGDWQRRLHVRDVLLNFGFDEGEARALRETTLEDGTRLVHDCLRWLSKGFSAYGPTGCLVDLVNLAFAMYGIPVDHPSEEEICRKLEDFRGKLLLLLRDPQQSEASLAIEDSHAAFWVPDQVIMDGELDDTMAVTVLAAIHKVRGTQLRVLTQLPQDREADRVAAHLKEVSCGCVTFEVFRDSESRNKQQLLLNFSERAADVDRGRPNPEKT